MRTQRTPETALTGGGAIAIIAGTSLPWFRVDPRFDPLTVRFPEVYGALSEPGIHGVGLVMFGVVGAVLLAQLLDVDRRGRVLAPVLGGSGIALYCLHYPVLSSRIGPSEPIVPVLGWYLTLLGGLLLVVSGLSMVVARRTA